MDVGVISIVLIAGLLFLLAIGMPLGFASAVLAALVMIMKFEPMLLTDPMSFGDGMLSGRPGTGPLYILTQKVYDLMTEYVLLSVPLFIFMASLLERSGVAKQMYDSLNFWMSRMRGGIAVVTSLMAVLMAAMSGIIGGEVVLLGLIALPQMLRLGYNQNLAIGTICASGSLGTMIPPSIVLIIYGLITETSIKALFTGAFLPGFMLASFIIIYILVRTRLDPSQAPLPEPREDDLKPSEKFKAFCAFISILVAGFTSLLLARLAFLTVTGRNVPDGVTFEPPALGMAHHAPYLIGIIVVCFILMFGVLGLKRTKLGWHHGKGLVPPFTVIGIVLGSIYGGITGITEAAGMGALAVFLIAAFRGEASVDLVWVSLMRTLRSTGTIIWVTVGAAALAGAYTLAGGPTYIADLIVGAEMPTMAVILIMMAILLFMGAFMDWVGIVLLIIPVFLPIVQRLPIEEIGLLGQLEPRQVAIWFGVLFCMNMQVSFLSPPFGPAAFYLKSVAPAHISLTDIFRGFLPFIGIQLLALCVLLIWPSIVTILL
ncbi:TRAP transporter large permease subunit [Granulosicoccus sp.]|nr:TRAP transporter large permease subunit [Granulosicoccus sp.]MDB4222154.1 TRAP transporter large permease subunit [Granulosicoccus sp.]